MKLSATLIVSALVASAQAREFIIGLDSLKVDSDKPFSLEKRQHKFLDSDAFTVDGDEFNFKKVKRAPHKCHGRKQRQHNQPTQPTQKHTSYSDQLLAYFKSLLPFNSFVKDTFDTPVTNPEDQHALMAAESINSPGLLQSSLTQHPEIYTFTGYIRDSHALSSRFNSRDKFSIVFAPTDEALFKLGQKPWEFPTPIPDNPENEARNEQIIKDNVHNFVSSHVSFSETPLTVGNHVTTTNGVVVTLAERDAGRLSLLAIDKRGKTLVADIVKVETVKNGQVFIIDSSLIKP